MASAGQLSIRGMTRNGTDIPFAHIRHPICEQDSRTVQGGYLRLTELYVCAKLESHKNPAPYPCVDSWGADGRTHFGEFTKNENIHVAVQAGHT